MGFWKRYRRMNKNIIAFSIMLIGIAGIAVGIVRGEAGIVLEKAIHICLECVGIG